MFYIIFTFILFFLIYYRKHRKYEFFNTNDNILEQFKKLYDILEEPIIYKNSKSTEIIINNFTKLNKILNFNILRNLKYTNNKTTILTPGESNDKKGSNLLYLNKPLDHIYNTYSGYLISNTLKTQKINKKYGFIFDYNSNDHNNYAEISIDFNSNQKMNIEEFKNRIELQKSNAYLEIPRKNINIYTINNYTNYQNKDLYKDYFNYTNAENINRMIFVFNSTINKDFFKLFEDNKFNILDYNHNYILTDIKLDTPYCSIDFINKKDKDDKRDSLTTGIYNPMLKDYILFDTDEYTEYKKNNNLYNYNSLKDIQKEYTFFNKTSIDPYDDPVENPSSSEECPAPTGCPEHFEGYISNKYKNITEHFTNEFKNNKYISYNKIKDCSNSKEQESIKNKYIDNLYSTIPKDSFLFKNSDIITKLIDLTDFKIRKHYNNKQFYFGGIDYDGKFKGLSHNDSIILFDNEKEANNNINKLLKNKKIDINNLSNEQKQIKYSKSLTKLKQLNEMRPLDVLDPSFIGKKYMDDYKLYMNFNCFPHFKKDNTCIKTVDDTINEKRYNQDIITFNEKLNGIKPITTIDNNKVLEINQKIKDKIDKKIINNNYILIEKENIINYLIEPHIKKYKNNDIGFLFNKFKYKIVLKPITKNGINKTIIEIHYDNKYETNLKENNNTFYLEENDRIYINFDSKNKFSVVIYRDKIIISTYTSQDSLKGTFGEDINLFIRTNNKSMFRNFNTVEKINKLTYPYNPFINFYYNN